MIFWAVDRIEGSVAVLLSDDGEEAAVPLRRLPSGVREGAVLRVARAPGGEPRWETARPDPEEGRSRLERARRLLEELSESDPGTDLDL